LELVIDAIIIFAAFIKDSKTREILISNKYVLYAPEYLQFEINKHVDYLQNKTGLTTSELKKYVSRLFFESNINIISKNYFSNFLQKAEIISPDPDDCAYFALALKLKCGIWSNDKDLKNQNIVNIYSTKDLLDIF